MDARKVGSSLPDASRRLDRLRRMCVEGQVAAAELELHDWRREADCPPAARVLLASLLARRGELEHARDVLGAVLLADIRSADAQEAQTLVALLAARGCTDTAARVADALRRAYPEDEPIRVWVRAMAVTDREDPAAAPAPAESTAAELAAQLRDAPHLIPTLVYAQKQSPGRESIALLRAALTHVEAEFQLGSGHAALCQALADLALLARDHADARRWAQRGLAIEPYSAQLAMVLNQVSDEPAYATIAIKTLDAVAARFPHYPDVRAALIRREEAAGRHTAARQRLAEWLEDEPESPMANKLRTELQAA